MTVGIDVRNSLGYDSGQMSSARMGRRVEMESVASGLLKRDTTIAVASIARLVQ